MNEKQSSDTIEIKDLGICPRRTVKETGRVVPVSALSLFVEDPIEANRRYVGGYRATATPGLISGRLEHLSRNYAFNELRKIYLEAEQSDDLRASYDILQKSIERAKMDCEDNSPFLGLNIGTTAGDLLNRLRMEEDSRIVAASNLIREGIKGFDLVCMLFPIATEFEIRSQSLGLIGRIDAVFGTHVGHYPIDYKTEVRTNWILRESEKIQMAAYCMLIEEYYGTPCNYAEIYYCRYFKTISMFVDQALKNHVLEVRSKFIEDAFVEDFPKEVLA